MNPLDFSIPLTLGLVSSLHCSQMCGPIVLAYSLPIQGRVLPHLAYNAGRLLTYSLMGAVAGAFGGGLQELGRLAGIEKGAAIVAGAAMIVAGLLLSGWLPQRGLVQIGGGIPTAFSRTLGRLLKSSSAASKLFLGLALGFLPCGLAYAALLKALDSGSPAAGAVTMLAFGTGTSAALLAIGVFSSVISRRLGRYANTLASVSFFLLGAYLLYRGLKAGPAVASCHHGSI